jgi:nucleoside-diphosphate-sugar epimerase
MNALITGGSGYYGEHLTRKLIKNGFNCTILDTNDPSYDLKISSKYLKIDIRDKSKVSESLIGIDYVFHNVAQVPLAKNTKLFNEVNYMGTQNILEASLKNNIKKFIYTSSSAIYGVPISNPISEISKANPQESYGKAKFDGENEVIKYSKLGLNSVIIRPRTILGHGRLGIFQILFEWIYQGKKIPVFDGGKNIYQFIHSDDLAQATINSVFYKPELLDISFNIGCENYGTMYEMLDFLIKEVKSKSKIVSIKSGRIIPIMNIASKLGISPLGAYHALMYGKSMYFDINKAKSELNWLPQYSNNAMILESYKYYILNREKILYNSNSMSPHKSKVQQGVLSLLNYFL